MNAPSDALAEMRRARESLDALPEDATKLRCNDARAFLADVCDDVEEALDRAHASVMTHESAHPASGPGGVVSIHAAILSADLVMMCIGTDSRPRDYANEYIAAAIRFEGAVRDADAKAASDARAAAAGAISHMRGLVSQRGGD